MTDERTISLTNNHVTNCREENGELSREVLECFHLRHLQGILSIEHASVISVALPFLLNRSGQDVFSLAFCVPTSLWLVEKNQGLLPAPASLVLMWLPGKQGWGAGGDMVVVYICKHGFDVGVYELSSPLLGWRVSVQILLWCQVDASQIRLSVGMEKWDELLGVQHQCWRFSLPKRSLVARFTSSPSDGEFEFF